MEPLEYTLVPAAMMLFYLYEKGYLYEPPDGIVDFMDELESEFIEILKKRFSQMDLEFTGYDLSVNSVISEKLITVLTVGGVIA